MTRVRVFQSDRGLGLGASELATIAGVSPWATPLDTWLRKTEQTVTVPTDWQRWGLELEGLLVRQVENAKRNSMTWSHPEWPVVRLFATPDGIVKGGDELVEVKSVASRFADWADGAIPDYYRIQGMGQLACYPNARRVHYVALVGGRLEHRTMARDQAAIDELVEAAMRWWHDYIVNETVPPPTTDADRWTIARRNAAEQRMTRLAVADEEAAAADLLALRNRIAVLEAEEQETRLRLAELAGEADIAGSGWKATWATRVNRDYKGAWQGFNGTAHVPDEYVSESRVFTVRSIKETPMTETFTADEVSDVLDESKPTVAMDRVGMALEWGDLARLTKPELAEVKRRIAERIGVDLMLRPIDLIPTREGKLIPYINAIGAAELRRRHGLEVVAIEVVKERPGLVVMRCTLRGQDGRTDMAIGAADWREDKPQDEGRAWMVAETRAKRRATMSAVGIFLEAESDEVEGEAG